MDRRECLFKMSASAAEVARQTAFPIGSSQRRENRPRTQRVDSAGPGDEKGGGREPDDTPLAGWYVMLHTHFPVQTVRRCKVSKHCKLSSGFEWMVSESEL